MSSNRIPDRPEAESAERALERAERAARLARAEAELERQRALDAVAGGGPSPRIAALDRAVREARRALDALPPACPTPSLPSASAPLPHGRAPATARPPARRAPVAPPGAAVLTLAVFALIASGLAAWTARGARMGLASESWPQVQGEVLAAGVRTELVGTRNVARRTLRYRYIVEGQAYESERLSFAHHTLDGLSPGDRVPVFHDPQDPSVAVLQPGLDAWSLMKLVSGALVAALAWVSTLVSGGLALRRRRT